MEYQWVYRIKGDSMYPLLKEGEMVFLEEVKELSVGQIVVYPAEGGLIVHRLIAFLGSLVLTQGDNGYLMDPPIPRESILAVVKSKLYQSRREDLDELTLEGRCHEDLLLNRDRIFQYLINKSLRGLTYFVEWVTQSGKRRSMQDVLFILPSSPRRQSIIGDDELPFYLLQIINSILKYLQVVARDREEIIGLSLPGWVKN